MTRTKKIILIVDDDADYAQELAEVLSANGYETVSCGDGECGARFASMIVPDLILLDLKMLPISGLQMADHLKHRYDTVNIPLLGMTGHHTAREQEPLLKACGITECLKKPFAVPDAVAKIDQLLSENQSEPRGGYHGQVDDAVAS
jgi:two-component system, sensor histidine kinase ChiS